MANIKRSSIVGFHNIKNKVSRNAFDLSHRHMFTAQIGELLPVFVQWCNPNETFKLGYNGFSRTQPLQTAAFTRLKENIQYYFVPFQSLWKYFEQQVNNMTTGQSGENISRIAQSATEDTPITTGMPFINEEFIRTMFNLHLDDLYAALVGNFAAKKGTDISFDDVLTFIKSKGDVYINNETLRYSSTAKLLRALGYMNSDADCYDVVSNFVLWHNSKPTSYDAFNFRDSEYGLTFNFPNYMDVQNAPNLSIFPLLAYQKVINDHYLYRQWQPYKSYACNIDYLLPTDSMNFAGKLGNTPINCELFSMQYSNLPLDYFNGVLPKAQYGEESAVSVDVSNLHGTMNVKGATTQPTYTSNESAVSPATHDGALSVNGSSVTVAANGSSNPPYVTSVRTPHTHNFNGSVNGLLYADSSFKISALRSAIALQKYKEIQESNDSDFASQVLAHFGVKPKHDDYKSYFIGGGDSVIDINPQVNQNLADGNDPEIKATGAGQLSCGCKFTSDTYGIILGIYRCVPQLDLAHVGLDRNLFKTDASDFPIPELDRVGMQTQYRCEVVAPNLGTSGDKTDYFKQKNTYNYAQTYGYLPRYAELKTSYDRYEGAFLDSLQSWVTGYSSVALKKWGDPTEFGSPENFEGIDELIKCRPSIVNSIFVDQTALCCNNDKLLVGSVNTCVAIRPFSVYGLPYSK